MKVRRMLPTDVSTVADIGVDAFSRDELFTWLYPYQDKYPYDMRRWNLLRARRIFAVPGIVAYIAETEVSDASWTGTPEVVGYAFWKRSGKDEHAVKWMGDTWWQSLERYLLALEFRYINWLERASVKSRIQEFDAAAKDDLYDQLPSRWHLAVLAVSTQHQRQGIGRKLIQEILPIARQEEVPVTLEASVAGKALYKRMGFKTFKTVKVIQGLVDMNVMLWEPEGCEGRWLEVSEDGSTVLRKALPKA